MPRVLTWLVRDDELKPKLFEDFTLAVTEAIRLADTDKMSMIALPDGSEYTILKRPKSGAK